jgi:two-component system sensor kinase FixL
MDLRFIHGPNFADSRAQAGAATACLLAIAAIGLGVAGRLGLDSLLERATFLFFVPAVILSAALAGLWPGLFATLLGLVAGLAIEMVGDGISAGDVIVATLFLTIGTAVAVGGEWFQRARIRAAEVNQDLARREAHLRSILETIPDAMIVIDKRGLICDFSRAAQRLFGWNPAEVVGKNVSMLMPEPYRAAHDGYLQRYYALASGGSSASAGWSSASARMVPPSRWSWPWGKFQSPTGASSRGSSVT